MEMNRKLTFQTKKSAITRTNIQIKKKNDLKQEEKKKEAKDETINNRN